jgi:hypothetical protein
VDDVEVEPPCQPNWARNFNTQTDAYTAMINEEMLDLLFAGQVLLERRDCDNFDKTVSRVLHLMLLHTIDTEPARYGTQYVTTRQRRHIGMYVGIGQVMALSVLPIVQKSY